MDFIAFLQGLPAPVWGLAGAIVGVVGTLGANLLSNRSNDRRFDRQLIHDATQKSKDRAAQMRREVYLAAVDEIVAVNEFVGQLASLDPTDRAILTAGFNRFLRACARVQLVASESARTKVSELSSAYGKMFMDMMGEASVAHNLKISLNINREAYEDIQGERTRLLSAMRVAREETNSKYQIDALLASFELTVKSVEDSMSEYSDLADRYGDALVAYGKKVAIRVADLAILQAEVSALLRSEFDLDVDVDNMKRQAREQVFQATQAMDGFFKKLKDGDGA
ncbi:hypothetical protein [Lysobacter capsici]|uniref:hypothetical protein n=1 Tax=Lysobacter capsici TaxID=435897 RepID=UPI000AD92089|nr:hypothetical protein [Lysobacter capsici]